jgi:hypothetical protein
MHQRPSDESLFPLAFSRIFKGVGDTCKSLLTVRKIQTPVKQGFVTFCRVKLDLRLINCTFN